MTAHIQCLRSMDYCHKKPRSRGWNQFGIRATFFGSIVTMLCSTYFQSTQVKWLDARTVGYIGSLIDVPSVYNSTKLRKLTVHDGDPNTGDDGGNDLSFSPSPQCSEKKNTSEFRAFCQMHSYSKNKCQKKKRELYPIGSPPGETTITNANATATEPLSSTETRCKTIWITGMSLGFDGKHHVANGGDGYVLQYATAIQSYIAHAKETLQPILILLTPPPLSDNTNGNNDDSIASQFTRWLEARGIIVIRVYELSFENLVFQAYPEYATNGAIAYYLRFDIPRILLEASQHKHVLDRPDICGSPQSRDNVVLYTDSDVLFVQPLSYDRFQNLKNQLTAEKFLMYGQDFLIDRRKPSNTGVMLMHLEGFSKEWPRLLKWGRKRAKEGNFPIHDQLWLNQYFAHPKKWKAKNLLLPPVWNWKVYWELDHGSSDDENSSNSMTNSTVHEVQLVPPIQIVHFHGPKPKDGVEEIAFCDTGAVLDVLARIDSNIQSESNDNKDWSGIFHPDYEMFVTHGMCCDSGKTAAWVLKLYKQWKPAMIPW